MRRRLLLAAGLVAGLVAGQAGWVGVEARAQAKLTAEQQRRRVDYLPARQIENVRARLTGSPMLGATVLTAGDQQTNYVLVRRAVTSDVEMHARWDDLVIVRAGRGAIEFGERAQGLVTRAVGEWRGGELVPVHRLVVGAGDIIRVPAAVPHRFVVGDRDTLEYLLIKQRKKELPLRPTGAPR